MTVEIEGTAYDVRWYHTNNHIQGKNRKGSNTECMILERVDEQLFEVVGKGIAKCSKRDNFCKATGRKISFVRALGEFTKEQRKIFWEVYLSFQNGVRNITMNNYKATI